MTLYKIDITGNKVELTEDEVLALQQLDLTTTPQVPAKVSNYQARTVLIRQGLFEQVDAAIRASGNLEMVQAWDYANEYYRISPFITAMGNALGMTEAQIDDLFIAADQVL